MIRKKLIQTYYFDGLETKLDRQKENTKNVVSAKYKTKAGAIQMEIWLEPNQSPDCAIHNMQAIFLIVSNIQTFEFPSIKSVSA
jgi:hypothetical protein